MNLIFNKHHSLKKVYYRSFFLMIVIPILLLFLIAVSVVGVMMQQSAISNIQNSQRNIADNLTEDIRQISLQLSHFVYVNNGEIMEMAAGTDTDSVEERYAYSKELTEAFQVAMIPKQNIISGMFFMKSKKDEYLKDEITIPRPQLEKESWYVEAKDKPNNVTIGSYDTSVSTITHTGVRKNQLVLVAAMSPDIGVDKSGKIELVSLFTISRAGELIMQCNTDALLGTSVVVDGTGRIIYGSGADPDAAFRVSQMPVEKQGVERIQIEPDPQRKAKAKFTVVTTHIEGTDWSLVTYIKSRKITEEFNKVAAMLIGISAGLFLLFYIFSKYFLKNIINPIHHMVEGLEQVEIGDLNTHIEPEGQHEIRSMIHSFNQMVRRLNSSVSERDEAQANKHQAEIKALQSQINPHFLVNTLNSIRFMAQVAKFDGIRKMAEALIRILSCSFRSNISFYTIAEELEVLDSYIYLMKIRYSDGFDVSYDVEEGCKNLMIPRLILQPIAENAIVHGFADTGEDIGHLHIVVKREGDSVCLQVTDDGKGMTKEEIEAVLTSEKKDKNDNYSIGIQNVSARLSLNFGEAGRLTIVSKKDRFTTVTIHLPTIKEEGKEEYETGIDHR